MNTSKFIEHVGNRNINSIDEAAQYIQLKMLSQLQTGANIWESQH